MHSIDANQIVVVVGAGLAGLTAAYDLHQAGFPVLVFEAQSRVGGRVYTAKGEFLQDQYAEAGGEFLDAQQIHPQIHRYIEHFGLALEPVGHSAYEDLYYFRQKRFTFVEADRRFGRDVTADVRRFWQAFTGLGEFDVNVDNIDNDERMALLDRQSVAQWLDELALHPVARTIIEEYLCSDFDDPRHISLLALAHDARLYGHVASEQIECYRINGGNHQLPEAMAAALDGCVHVNTPVTAVMTTAQGVKVRHICGEVRARWVVLATPLPALKHIMFSPVLPPRLRRAVCEINYSRQIKVQLQYRRRFWRDQGLSGTTITDLPLGRTWEATEGQPGDMGILTVYTAGNATLPYGAADDAALVQAIVAQLEEIYPGSRAAFVTAKVFQWNKLRHAGGAFTCYAPGQLTAFWSILRQPHGPIYFAGEHTDSYWGYMEGAVRSGQRVARQIIASAG